jgi:hypothetical protein
MKQIPRTVPHEVEKKYSRLLYVWFVLFYTYTVLLEVQNFFPRLEYDSHKDLTVNGRPRDASKTIVKPNSKSFSTFLRSYTLPPGRRPKNWLGSQPHARQFLKCTTVDRVQYNICHELYRKAKTFAAIAYSPDWYCRCQLTTWYSAAV